MILCKDMGRRKPNVSSKETQRYGIYICPSCNKHFETIIKNVTSGKTTQCRKCAVKKIGDSNRIHGEAGTRKYRIWSNIKSRCFNKNSTSFDRYGGREITMCQEWVKSYECFRDWAVANGYRDDLQIDRINNNGNYSPDNCRWTTLCIQARNKEKVSKNTSGYIGVSKVPSGNSVARIGVDNKRIHIGTFMTAFVAALAYDSYVLGNCLEHTLNFTPDAVGFDEVKILIDEYLKEIK